jgi:hypothetical protein
MTAVTSISIFAAFGCILAVASPTWAQQELPAGFSDGDPLTRMYAVEQAGKQKLMMAEGKIAAMAKTDPSAEVRRAACLALADMWVAINDPNADVRAAALKASKTLSGDTGEAAAQTSSAASPRTEAGPADNRERDKYKMPELTYDKEEIVTRNLALGFGTMGGYGIAAIDMRGRIKTGAAGLPWVGIELGGGWTPPTGYQIVAGPIGKVNDEENKWRIISVAGSALLYFQRSHYVPIRAGWDVGRGMYFLLGYGYESLNDEGFFSWGGEVGILYQPLIGDNIGNLVSEKDSLWPVIPYVRFTLHFYLA